jgi:hypothetical protein
MTGPSRGSGVSCAGVHFAMNPVYAGPVRPSPGLARDGPREVYP